MVKAGWLWLLPAVTCVLAAPSHKAMVPDMLHPDGSAELRAFSWLLQGKPAALPNVWLSLVQSNIFSLLHNNSLSDFEPNLHGCYKCTQTCHSSACDRCRLAAGAADVKEFCHDEAGVADPCAECPCCQRARGAYCSYGSGLCIADAKEQICALRMRELSESLETNIDCSSLLSDLNNGKLGFCDSPCFPELMQGYAAMFHLNCLEEYALSPSRFETIACNRTCGPSVGCSLELKRTSRSILQDPACAETVQAIRSNNITTKICNGNCYLKIADDYKLLHDQNCFSCDADFPPPDFFSQQNCLQRASEKVAVVSDENFEHCNALITQLRSRTLSEGSCKWIHSSFDLHDWTGVCQSTCFVKYLTAYQEILDSGCAIDEISPSSADLKDMVCSLQQIQEHEPTLPSYQGKTAIVNAIVELSAHSPNVAEFQAQYKSALIQAIGKIVNATASRITLNQFAEGENSIVVKITISIPAALGQRAVHSLNQDIGRLPTLLERLAKRNPVAGAKFIEIPTLSIVDPCQEASYHVNNFCSGCDNLFFTRECCLAVAEGLQAGCPSLQVCGENLSEFSELRCPVADELMGIFEYYYDQTQPASDSPAPTTSSTISVSSSTTASAPQTPSRSTTPTWVESSTTTSVSPSATPSRSDFFKAVAKAYHAAHHLPPGNPQFPASPDHRGIRKYCVSGNNTCECIFGYTGNNCEIHIFKDCPRQCSGLGLDCVDKKCICKPGYSGPTCSQFDGCPGSNCSGHGICTCTFDGCHCLCATGFSGPDCATADFRCPNQCSARGSCSLGGACICDKGWTGDDCSVAAITCPQGCSGHGTCNPASGVCVCSYGFTGLICDFVDHHVAFHACAGCFGRGKCDYVTGRCSCEPGYEGKRCERTVFRFDCKDKQYCNGNGICNTTTGECNCSSGFSGVTCTNVVGCPNHCSGHGSCRGNPSHPTCACKKAWDGADCNTPKCLLGPNGALCSENGICEKKKGIYRCSCDPGFSGDDCSIAPSPSSSPPPSPAPTPSTSSTIVRCGGNNCSNHGTCNDLGKCECFTGFTGDDCLGLADDTPGSDEF